MNKKRDKKPNEGSLIISVTFCLIGLLSLVEMQVSDPYYGEVMEGYDAAIFSLMLISFGMYAGYHFVGRLQKKEILKSFHFILLISSILFVVFTRSLLPLIISNTTVIQILSTVLLIGLYFIAHKFYRQVVALWEEQSAEGKCCQPN